MKNLSLGIKIGLGFSIILVFLCIVAWIGFNSMSGVVDRTSKSDGVNELVKSMLDARQQEKNYIMRNDTNLIAKVDERIKDLVKRAGELKEEFAQKANKDQMGNVVDETQQYLKEFHGYVELRRQKAETMDKMRTSAGIVLKQAEDIRADQRAQLTAVREKNTRLINEKVALADDANRLVKLILDAKVLRVSLSFRHDDQELETWKRINSDLVSLAKDVKSRFVNDANIKAMDSVISSYLSYEKAALEFFISKSEHDRQAMVKDAVAAVEGLQNIRADQKTQLAEAQKAADIWLTDKTTKADDANRVIKWFLDGRKNEKEFIISGDKNWLDNVNKRVAEITELTQKMKSSYKQQKNIDQVNELIQALKEYETAFKLYVDLTGRQRLAEDTMVTAARKARDVCVSARIDQKAKMDRQVSTANRIILIGTLIALLLGIIAAFFITRSITRPVNRIITGLNEGANQVASASGQVSSSSQSMAEGASEQAASIEETSSSMEEMSSMTKKNAENATNADGLMKEANQVVDTASESMDHLTKSMEDISKASEETSKIIKTIDEIAFQTNLLALNAAVEAARAGEAGAGFAVVADEVRNLAMRAAEAAKDTAALIEDTVKKVNDGSEIVTSTNDAFSKVAESTAKVGELVSEISEASNEQSNGIEQVNIAITEMDRVVQQNAANAEESASAAEEMSAQAEQLKEYVDDLVMLVTGKNNSSFGYETHNPMRAISATPKSKLKKKKMMLAHTPEEVRPDQVIPFDEDEAFKDF